MTKKEYVVMARIMSDLECGESYTKQDIIAMLVVFFRQDNPRFDERGFREACEVCK